MGISPEPTGRSTPRSVPPPPRTHVSSAARRKHTRLLWIHAVFSHAHPIPFATPDITLPTISRAVSPDPTALPVPTADVQGEFCDWEGIPAGIWVYSCDGGGPFCTFADEVVEPCPTGSMPGSKLADGPRILHVAGQTMRPASKNPAGMQGFHWLRRPAFPIAPTGCGLEDPDPRLS